MHHQMAWWSSPTSKPGGSECRFVWLGLGGTSPRDCDLAAAETSEDRPEVRHDVQAASGSSTYNMGGKKNKGNKKGGGSGSASAADDDALLEAAIKESQQAKEEAQLAEMVAEADAARKKAAANLASGRIPQALTPQQVVEKLNDVPTFAILHETESGKKFVPLRFKEDANDGEHWHHHYHDRGCIS